VDLKRSQTGQSLSPFFFHRFLTGPRGRGAGGENGRVASTFFGAANSAHPRVIRNKIKGKILNKK